MNKPNSRKNSLGSSTAKSGFANERAVADKFNNWRTDKDAQTWLEIMGYKLKEIEKVIAKTLHGYKTDVQVQVTIFMRELIAAENLSVKLVSNPRGYNQVDKRWVDSYKDMWNIPESIVKSLKLFTGEIAPDKKGLRDKRRIFLDELEPERRNEWLKFFRENKILIVSDILKGRDEFPAKWFLVILKQKQVVKWSLNAINETMNFFGGGDVQISPRGSLAIGKITMQRKGGDAGRDTAKMLQFKINPVEIMNLS